MARLLQYWVVVLSMWFYAHGAGGWVSSYGQSWWESCGGEWGFFLVMISSSGYHSWNIGGPLVKLKGGATETPSLWRPPVVVSRLSLARIKPWESRTMMAVAVQGAPHIIFSRQELLSPRISQEP
jgi:hypothetical protein